MCKHPTSDTLLTSDYDKDEAFSKHFSSVFTREDTFDLPFLQSELPTINNFTLLTVPLIYNFTFTRVYTQVDMTQVL